MVLFGFIETDTTKIFYVDYKIEKRDMWKCKKLHVKRGAWFSNEKDQDPILMLLFSFEFTLKLKNTCTLLLCFLIYKNVLSFL
jgi:uncharacterized protein Smg (DUF494 family)